MFGGVGVHGWIQVLPAGEFGGMPSVGHEEHLGSDDRIREPEENIDAMYVTMALINLVNCIAHARTWAVMRNNG